MTFKLNPWAAALGLLAAAFAPVQGLRAAPTEPAQVIVVTATRSPMALERVAADVVVIDEQRIRASTADSLEDLLRREAGLQLSRNGGPGANAGLFIRGGGSANTLLLIDGVRVGSATLGTPELEALSLAAIERIEVLRGPASSLYGADGSGGVIQVFTRRATGKPAVAARVAAGGHGAREASVNGSAVVGDWDLSAGTSRERMAGVSALRPGDPFGNYNPDADGFDRRTAQARVGWTPVAGHRLGLSALDSRLTSRFDSAEYPPPDYAPDSAPDFKNRQHSRLAAGHWTARWNDAWTTTVRLASQRGELVSGASTTDRYLTERTQVDVEAAWRIGPGQRWVLALADVAERAESSAYPGPFDRRNRGYVSAYSGSWGGLDVQADLRHDDNTAYGGVNTGRLGLSMPVGAGWRVRALAGNSFRAPSVNDLFYPGYGVLGIRPERSRSVEVGVDGRWLGTQLAATAFRNRARNLIGYQPDAAQCPADPAYAFGCAANIGRARLQGLALTASRRQGAWEARAVVDFLSANDELTGQRLARRASRQGNLSLAYDAGAWNLGATALHVGSRPEGAATLRAYTTIDLKAQWRISPGLWLDARLLNATDEDYEPARSYQSMGRQAWLGLRWEWAGR